MSKDYYSLSDSDKINLQRFSYKMVNKTKTCVDLFPEIDNLLKEKENSKFIFFEN